MSKLTFTGDVFLETPCYLPFEDIVVINHEFVINSLDLIPVPNKVNLCAKENTINASIPKAKKILANLSNNHIFDYGNKGLQLTHEALIDANVFCFGDVIESQAKNFIEIDNMSCCFLGYYMNAFTPQKELNEMMALLNTDINNANVNGVDRIFVSFHFGNEHYPNASVEQQAVSHLAIDLGAELVIGHHTHCIQNAEHYKGKWIFYGLGNTYFPKCCLPSYFTNEYTSSALFVNKDLSWQVKGLVVNYNMQNGEIEVIKTNCKNKDFRFEKAILPNSLKPIKNAVLIGEIRKIILFISSLVFPGKGLLNMNYVKLKFSNIIKNKRWKNNL